MPLTTLGSQLITKTLLSDPFPLEVLNRANVPGLFVVSLFTTNPDVSGNGGVEPSEAKGYSRAIGVFSSVEGPATALGGFLTGAELVNSTDIEFPTPSADWGTVVGIGVYYPANSVAYPDYTSRPIFWESLALTKTVNSGEKPILEAGEVKIFLGADR